MQHLTCRTDRASHVPLHADLCSWPVDPSGTGDWKFQLALLPQNFQWHSPSCFMFLASVVEPGVGAFDWQNLHLRPVPTAAERLGMQVCSVYPLKRG